MDISIEELLLLQSLGDCFEDDEEVESTENTNDYVTLDVQSIHDPKKRTYLSNEQRRQLIIDLFSMANKKLLLRRGIMKDVAEKYGVSRYTVGKLWKDAVAQRKRGEEINVATNKHRCGRKAKHPTDETLKVVPLKQRTTIRSFAKALIVSVSTVHRLVQKGLNILDLGFFRAIQSIQHQTFPDTVPKLIRSVKDAYEGYDPREINNTWLHLMYVMLEVLKVKGGNNYKLPHIGKKMLERQCSLPEYVEVDDELVTKIVNVLNSNIVSGSSVLVDDNQIYEEETPMVD